MLATPIRRTERSPSPPRPRRLDPFIINGHAAISGSSCIDAAIALFGTSDATALVATARIVATVVAITVATGEEVWVYADPLDALAELATQGDPDSIARFLLEHGVKGQRRLTCECPVALWLGRRTCLTFVVENDDVWLWPDDWAELAGAQELTLQRWPLPAVVGEFIERFDSGNYPELER